MSYPKKLIALFTLAAALSGSILLSNGVVVEASNNNDSKNSVNRQALNKIKYSLQDKIKASENNGSKRLKRLQEKRNKIANKIEKLKSRAKDVSAHEKMLVEIDQKLNIFKETEKKYFETLEELAKVNRTKSLKKLMSETGDLDKNYREQLQELKQLINELQKSVNALK